MPSGSDGPSALPPDLSLPPFRLPRPLLLPSNRRLRHLEGISLRNLGAPTTPPPAPPELPATDENADPRTSMRRRRSTKTINPLELRLWEDVVTARRGDVFFSLHLPAAPHDPIYISEVVEKSMNPDFQAFDLDLCCAPEVGRSNEVIVRVWCDWGDGWRLAIDAEFYLGALSYLGRDLEAWRYPLPGNAVVFSMSDGVYTSFWDGEAPGESAPAETPTAHTTTSSYDALMKLNTLSDCIQDALTTTAQLTTQISALVAHEQAALTLPRAVSQAREHAATVTKSLTTERRRLDTSHHRLHTLSDSLTSRRAALAAARASHLHSDLTLDAALPQLSRSRAALASTRESIAAQQQRIVAVLSDIYPILPHPSGELLAFTIRGLHLPSIAHEDHNDQTVSAALGCVVHLVHLLSYYLSTPLRYPVQALGSRSFVRDDISVIQGARTFPLWMRGTVYYRFEYAVFLVNKDVQQLMSAVGLHCVDVRHTLANLKSLGLFVAGGGGGEGKLVRSATRRVSSRCATPVPTMVGALRAPSRCVTPVLGVTSRSGTPGVEEEVGGRKEGVSGRVVRPVALRPFSVLAGRGV